VVAEQVDTLALGVAMLRDALRRGDAIDMTASGFSMWPRIQDGSLVHVEPCSGADVDLGDVVLFEEPRRLVLHRVLRATESHVFTKGDACFQPDGWVAREQVLGRIPRRPGDSVMARVSPYLSRPLGFASILARRISGLASKF
jgi:signal peptidase I